MPLPHIVDHPHLHVQTFTPHVTLPAQIVRLLCNFFNWKNKNDLLYKRHWQEIKASSMKSKYRELYI